MNLKTEFKPIRDWAEERGLYSKGDVKTQMIKLQEEVGELAQSIIKHSREDFIDAVGDCIVVLTNLSKIGSDHFKNSCTSCGGEGSHYEDVAGDGGSKMLVDCEECSEFNVEDCINQAYQVIKNRQGSMKNGTFVKQ